MSEIKGVCADCFHLRREWTFVTGTNGEHGLELDTFCGLCELFKRSDGYCDFWKLKDW